MPSTTTPMPTLSPTPTYNNPTIMSIARATVVSFDKNPNDQKIWYKIRVEPTSGKKYFISRKYDDFCQLSQKLHDRFYNNKSTTTKSFVLPAKLIKHRIQLLPLNKQERLQELNHFLYVLFQKQQLPNILADSYIVLEFFQDVFLDYQDFTAAVINDSLPSNNHDIVTPTPSTSSRWKRLRCTSFLASRSPPTGLSSLCSQAANKIIPSWHRTHHQPHSNVPKPSVSTPAIHTLNSQPMRQNNKQVLKKSKSSLGIYASVKQPQEESSSKIQIPTATTSTTSTTTTMMIQKDSELKTTIKIKVIYDKENIIVIQVPRTISLTELRSRISQKFSELNMVNDSELVLLFNDNSSSCSSSILSSSNDNQILLPAVLLTKDQDLSQIMHTKWNRLEKVTLRCII